jgi:PKD repeat protein
MTRHSAGTYCLCILGVLTLLAAAGSAFEVAVGDATLTATGDTVQLPISLDEAPQGYAGSTIWFNLSEPSVAEIIAVELPAWASPKGNSAVPADAISITLGDFGLAVNNGDANIGLGTLTIRGDLKGQTFLNISVGRFTADGGSTLKPSTRNATIMVGTLTPPEAQFSADVTSGKEPLTVQFTDASTNTPTTW